MSYILDQEQLDGLEEALTTDLMTLGIQSVILIDMAGNVIVNLDDGKVRHDVYSCLLYTSDAADDYLTV